MDNNFEEYDQYFNHVFDNEMYCLYREDPPYFDNTYRVCVDFAWCGCMQCSPENDDAPADVKCLRQLSEQHVRPIETYYAEGISNDFIDSDYSDEDEEENEELYRVRLKGVDNAYVYEIRHMKLTKEKPHCIMIVSGKFRYIEYYLRCL